MRSFDLNLSLVLAHSIVHELKSELSPGGIVDDARCDTGGASPISPFVANRAAGQATVNWLPRISEAISQAAPGLAQGNYNASAQVSPQYAALDLALKNAFGQANADADAAIASRNVSNLSDVFQGSGRDLVSSSLDLAKLADPEFYSSRAVASSKLNDLLGGQDPNRLTEPELENATRGVNRVNQSRGNVNAPSETTTVSNAMMFGDALSSKRKLLADSLGVATGAIPAFKSGTDTFKQVTGRSGTDGLAGTSFTKDVGESNTLNTQASGIGNRSTQAFGSFNENQDMRSGYEKIMGSLPDY